MRLLTGLLSVNMYSNLIRLESRWAPGSDRKQKLAEHLSYLVEIKLSYQ